MIVWLGIITFASSISNPFVVVPEDVQLSNEFIGRIAHMLEFTILSLLVSRAFFDPEISRIRLLSKSLTTSGVCAAFDEVHQYFVPGRTFELLDLGLDGVGIVLGLVLFVIGLRVSGSHIENRRCKFLSFRWLL